MKCGQHSATVNRLRPAALALPLAATNKIRANYRYMKFTEEQTKIFEFVRSGNGHGIIDAVAGAGKTTTIMECAKHIPSNRTALFCAFNNSIADEIRARFTELKVRGVITKTIHSLGFGILKSNLIGSKKYKLDERKYSEVLKSAEYKNNTLEHYKRIVELNELDPDGVEQENQSFAIRNLIYDINGKLLDINQKARSILLAGGVNEFRLMTLHFNIFSTIDSEKENFDKEVDEYFALHKVLLARGNQLAEKFKIIDFTDMIYLPFRWKLTPVNKYDFLFIDECQDLSKAQLAVATKYGKKGTRVLSVGDPRQSIYGFTGADIESFGRIKKMTKATELPLTLCFRCPIKVIELAKDIRSDIKGSKDYEGIVAKINRKSVIEIARPGDLIISRIKAPLMEMVFEFIKKNVKVRIHPDEVRDFIGDLKRIFKKDESNSDIEIVYGSFEKFKDKVSRRWKWIFQKNSERILDEAARAIYIKNEERNLDAKLDFLYDRYIIWRNEVDSVKEIIEELKNFITADKNSIRLSSIHRAKGLEENNVFIIDYDRLPFQRPDQKDWEKIQEVNLKYVALTRAKEALYQVTSPSDETEEGFELEDEGSLFDELDF